MLYDIVANAEAQLEEWLEENAEQVRADALGLDERCGTVWVCDEAVICNGHARGRLEYYGGFEYVDKEYVTQVGSYVIYNASGDDDCRVQECIERWQDSKVAA
jgi:hypothetical protein